jgi:multidrug efflux pump subunit AcrA (membrane-fusion protein)
MNSVFTLLSAVAALSWLGACSEQATPPAVAAASAPVSAASAPAPAGPPVTVSTFRASKRDMSINLKASGTVTAMTSVDIRAQMSSTVNKIHAKEG